MTALWIAACLGALVLVEHPLDGVRIGELNPLTGTADVNFRHADMNGDGATDIVLGGSVLFQHAGGFLAPVTLPEGTGASICDLWGNVVYRLDGDTLTVYSWDGDAWRAAQEQPFDVALSFGTSKTQPTAKDDASATSRFERFLTDLDGDGTPEIILPLEQGLAVFADREGRFVEVQRLDVYPPIHIVNSNQAVLWPPAQRRLSFPPRRMSCRYFFVGNELTTLTEQSVAGGSLQHIITTYTLDSANAFAVDVDKTRRLVSGALVPSVQPCRLNADAEIDFAGGDWSYAETNPAPSTMLPRPVFETVASLDGGKSFQSIRSVSFRPRCLFVDFDSDGDLDLIAESMAILESSARESIAQLLTSNTLTHRVSIHTQVDGKFERASAVSGQVTLAFSSRPMPNSPLFRSYLAGQLVDVSGDFNGDGVCDLTVQTAPRQIDVFFADLEKGRFATRPSISTAIASDAYFRVADIDGDGKSDLQVNQMDPLAETPRVVRTTFLTRDVAP